MSERTHLPWTWITSLFSLSRIWHLYQTMCLWQLMHEIQCLGALLKMHQSRFLFVTDFVIFLPQNLKEGFPKTNTLILRCFSQKSFSGSWCIIFHAMHLRRPPDLLQEWQCMHPMSRVQEWQECQCMHPMSFQAGEKLRSTASYFPRQFYQNVNFKISKIFWMSFAHWVYLKSWKSGQLDPGP